MTFSRQILAGLALGILTALFFGERADPQDSIPDELRLPIADAHVDAMLLMAERGSAWTLHVPAVRRGRARSGSDSRPVRVPIGKRDERFANFINTWIMLKRKDGTLDAVYKHWILGQDAAQRQPRWSIVRNVLHWTE
jgi:hypothetical protein